MKTRVIVFGLFIITNIYSVDDAKANEPPPLSADKLNVATFNIQNFGKTKIGKPSVMTKLAEIVRKYDVIAIDEVSDIKEKVPPAFLDAINSDGSNYAYILSERTGKQPNDKSSQEQYAFYYRIDALEVLGTPSLYDDSEHDYFQREPYVARFKAKNGNFTFVLIAIHTQPKAAVAEINSLEHVFVWAKAQYPEEDDFVALGDFNSDCSYAKDEQINASPIHTADYKWIIPNDVDTTVGPTDCAYDRIVVTKGATNDLTGDWGIDQAFTDTAVSDHWPVWVVFYMNRDGETQKNCCKTCKTSKACGDACISRDRACNKPRGCACNAE